MTKPLVEEREPERLTACVTDLYTSLANVDGNDFAHFSSRGDGSWAKVQLKHRVDNRSFDLRWRSKKGMKEGDEEKGGGLNGTCYPRA